jgi:hypothetical protein
MIAAFVRNKPPPPQEKTVRLAYIDEAMTPLLYGHSTPTILTVTSNDNKKAVSIQRYITILHAQSSFGRLLGFGDGARILLTLISKFHKVRRCDKSNGIVPLLHRIRPAPPRREYQL